MRVKEINEEVLYADGAIVKVGRQEIEDLKKKAGLNRRKRIRLCAHPDVEDELHEMLIVHTKDTYVRPHKHLTKGESIHVVEGALDLITFDDAGNITGVTTMGDYLSGSAFFHRMAESSYHTMLIYSDYLVFHETANGPFRRSDSVFPSWAPERPDGPETTEFMERLSKAVQVFVSRGIAGTA